MQKKLGLYIIALLIVSILGGIYLHFSQTFGGTGLRGDSSGVPVLLYHHLLPDKDNNDRENGAILSVEEFERHMDYLAANGYTSITLEAIEDYVQGKADLPPKPVLITFDDGYQSNYLFGYPILKKHGFTATVFLVTSWIEDEPEEYRPDIITYLSWPELEAMSDVFQFASHTHDLHWYQDGEPVVFHLEDDIILQDFLLSSQLLENSRYFAYPFGAYDQNIIDLLEEAGYTMAFTVEEGVVKPGDDPMELKRLPIFNWTTVRQLSSMLNRY